MINTHGKTPPQFFEPKRESFDMAERILLAISVALVLAITAHGLTIWRLTQ